MKTLRFLALAVSLCAAAHTLAAQDYAMVSTNARKPLMARREDALEMASKGTVPQPSRATLRMESLAASGEMQVSYTLPASEGAARLELTDMLTGQVLYAGQISAPGGQVMLPVQHPAGDYEARLITNANAISARLRP